MGGRSRAILYAAGLFFYLVAIPWACAGRSYYLGILATASALSVISLGVWLIFYIGRINLGQGGFALVGGYAAAIALTRLNLSYWLALPLAGAVSMLIGIGIGLPLLRLKGVYFSMITLSLTETARLTAQSLTWLTNGPNGLLNLPLPGELSLFGFTIIPDFAEVDTHLALFYLSAALLLLGLAAFIRLERSRLGWLFRSLRQNEELASSLGVDVPRLRVVAFAICTFYAGVGGAFFAIQQRSVYPASFTVQDSTYFLLYCFFGGLGNVFGAVIGSFALFLSFEFLQGFNQYQPLLYSLIMIGAMLWLPNGILGQRLFRRPAGGRSG